MALDTVFMIAQELLKLNAIVLIGIVLAGAFIAFKLFQIVVKVMLTGLAFGTFPFIANFLGIGVPVNVQTILWSVILGIVVFMTYMSMKFAFKVLNLAFLPLKKMFSKPKVKKVIVEKEKDK